jgi:DNA-directed RNA polymerase subunit beta'
MGRLIPAGTGVVAYKTLNLVIEGEPVEERFSPPTSAQAPPPPASLSAVNEE